MSFFTSLFVSLLTVFASELGYAETTLISSSFYQRSYTNFVSNMIIAISSLSKQFATTKAKVAIVKVRLSGSELPLLTVADHPTSQ